MCLMTHCRPLLSSTRFYELGQENSKGWNGGGSVVAASRWSFYFGVGERLVSFFSLGPGSALAWAKKKKIGEFGEGKRAIAGLASLADIFPIWPRFLPFPPTTEPGPRLLNFFFRFLFSVGVLLSVPSSRNLSCTVIFASVPCGGGVHIGCKVGVLWPPFKRTHLICGTHPSRGRGCPFAWTQKTNVMKIWRLCGAIPSLVFNKLRSNLTFLLIFNAFFVGPFSRVDGFLLPGPIQNWKKKNRGRVYYPLLFALQGQTLNRPSITRRLKINNPSVQCYRRLPIRIVIQVLPVGGATTPLAPVQLTISF